MKPLLSWLLAGLVLLAGPACRAEMTTTTWHITVGDRTRSYVVAQPSSCSADCPLMFDLHGFAGNAKSQQHDSGHLETGDEYGYSVVWPNGVQESWNAGESQYGSCCGFALDHDIDDVAFIKAVARHVAADYPVDRRRIYLSGWSNGCAMVQRVAAAAPETFAAEACTSMYLLTAKQKLARPISVTEFHGSHDPVVAYGASGDLLGAVGNLQRWAAMDHCKGEPVRTWLTEASYFDEYLSCAQSAKVRLYTIKAGHDTYSNNDGVNIAEQMWFSVRDHQLPWWLPI